MNRIFVKHRFTSAMLALLLFVGLFTAMPLTVFASGSYGLYLSITYFIPAPQGSQQVEVTTYNGTKMVHTPDGETLPPENTEFTIETSSGKLLKYEVYIDDISTSGGSFRASKTTDEFERCVTWGFTMEISVEDFLPGNYKLISYPTVPGYDIDSDFKFTITQTDIDKYEDSKNDEYTEGHGYYNKNLSLQLYPADSSQTPTPSTSDTGDVEQPSTWAADQVNAAITANLVPVSLQTKYTQTTTRAEFCALAVALYETATGKEITDRKTFYDTNDINVEKAAAISVVSGVGDNLFEPDAQLTREQAAVMLARLADSIGKPLSKQDPTFADNGSISSWAVEGVGQVQSAGIMGGVGDNTFAPKDNYTREQSIVTILRLYELVK